MIIQKNIILLLTGNFISIIGDRFLQIAIGFWVLRATNSTILMTSVLAVGMIPRIFLAPFAGAVIDRRNKKSILIICDFLSGLLCFSISIVSSTEHLLPFLFFSSFLAGILSDFYKPAVNSILPLVKDGLSTKKVNSYYGMTITIGSILGYVLGGVFYQKFSFSAIFFFNGVSFLASSILETFIFCPTKPCNEESKVTLSNSLLMDVHQSFSYLRQNSAVLFMFAFVFVINFFSNFAIVLMIPLYKNISSGSGSDIYGLMMGAYFVGIFLGMYLCSSSKLSRYSPLLQFKVTSLLLASTLLLTFLIPNLVLSAATFCFAAINIGITSILVNTAIHKGVPPEMHGRVFSFKNLVGHGLVPFAMVSAGFLASFIAIKTLILGGFSIVLLTVLVVINNSNLDVFFNKGEIK